MENNHIQNNRNEKINKNMPIKNTKEKYIHKNEYVKHEKNFHKRDMDRMMYI